MACGLAKSQTITDVGPIEGRRWFFLHSSHSSNREPIVATPLANRCICAYYSQEKGAYAPIYELLAETPNVSALLRGCRRAARTELLDCRNLRGSDPHDRDRCTPKFRYLSEANCSRPQRWARAVVVCQCAGVAVNGRDFAVRRQHRGSFWHGTNGRRRRCPLRYRHVHDRVCDRRRRAHPGKRVVRRRHGCRRIRSDLRLHHPADPAAETFNCAWCRDGRRIVWSVRYRAVRVAAAASTG